MNLSEVHAALAEAGVRPVKSLGQNFLHDQNMARWIADQARIEPADFVVEIGPGLGALTREILARGARVLAIEKDRRLVNFLQDKVRENRLEVQHADALEFDVRPLFAERNVKILGSLPYYIASQLLLHYIDYPTCISLAVFTLQDEMARRVSAVAKRSDFGALTLRLQSHYEVEYLRKIPNTVFVPQPEVASAIVRFRPRLENNVAIHDDELFREIVRLGFSQRRKQLRKLLANRAPSWNSLAQKIGVRLEARAEELSREQWIKLSNYIACPDQKTVAKNLEERFPVVDDQDREIGSASRSKVHEDNLPHRAIHIFLFGTSGELLLQKRSRWKDRHPLLWDSSAAGHVEIGEEYDQTAVRELNEELGVDATLKRIGRLPASEQTGQEFIWLYRGEHDGPFPFNRDEITAIKFFPVVVINRWTRRKPEDFAPGFLECWKLWRSTDR